MKHYVSKAMLQNQIDTLRKEIIVYEKKYYNNKNDPHKTATHLKKLRVKLHELKLELSTRNQLTILKNGKK